MSSENAVKTKGVSLPETLWATIDRYAAKMATAGRRPNRSMAVAHLAEYALRELVDENGDWEINNENK